MISDGKNNTPDKKIMISLWKKVYISDLKIYMMNNMLYYFLVCLLINDDRGVTLSLICEVDLMDYKRPAGFELIKAALSFFPVVKLFHQFKLFVCCISAANLLLRDNCNCMPCK